jgi:hypothetical protein
MTSSLHRPSGTSRNFRVKGLGSRYRSGHSPDWLKFGRAGGAARDGGGLGRGRWRRSRAPQKSVVTGLIRTPSRPAT